MTTAAKLSRFETCARAGFWGQDWESAKLDGAAMLQAALRAALTEKTRPDYGELAGETVMDLAATRGLATRTHNVYDAAVHHAAMADILAQAIRPAGSDAWIVPEYLGDAWESNCYLDVAGKHLRRIVLVSSWNEDRHYAEMRSWYTLGEVCHYGLPMQQVVVVLGQHREGRRHGPFSKGFLHPQNGKLRFRRKSKSSHETFNANWRSVWREDVGGDLQVKQWLQAMLEDDILRDVLFTVDVPVPDAAEVRRVKDMAARKNEALLKMLTLPDGNLSSCFWPVHCMFQPECHAGKSPHRGQFLQIEGVP